MVRVFKLEDAPLEKRATGSVRRVVDNRIGASRLGVILVEISAGAAPPGFHYHTKRESIYIGVEGRAKATIDGREYIVEPDTVVLISPGEKHRLENIGDIPFKMIEVYSPIEPDRVEAPEE